MTTAWVPVVTTRLAAATATLFLATGTAAAAPPPATNERTPINFTWLALAELELPGIGGLRLAVSTYLPALPIYLAGQLSRSFGLSPIHNAGQRDTWLTRQLTDTFTLEARVGLSLERWSIDKEELDYDFGHQWTPLGTRFQRNIYVSEIPTYNRETFYLGYRGRSVPGAKTCSESGPTPEDCAESGSGFLMVGYEHLSARKAVFDTVEHGALRVDYFETLAFHLLYSTDSDYSRETVLSRIGAEIVWTVEKDVGFQLSGGWDGNYVIFTAGMGGGGHYGFGGLVPATADIH